MSTKEYLKARPCPSSLPYPPVPPSTLRGQASSSRDGQFPSPSVPLPAQLTRKSRVTVFGSPENIDARFHMIHSIYKPLKEKARKEMTVDDPQHLRLLPELSPKKYVREMTLHQDNPHLRLLRKDDLDIIRRVLKDDLNSLESDSIKELFSQASETYVKGRAVSDLLEWLELRIQGGCYSSENCVSNNTMAKVFILHLAQMCKARIKRAWQIWMTAEPGAGKTTLKLLLKKTFPYRCFEVQVDADRYVISKGFEAAKDQGIWICDGWEPAYYKKFYKFSIFNRLTESCQEVAIFRRNQLSVSKYMAIFTILMTSYNEESYFGPRTGRCGSIQKGEVAERFTMFHMKQPDNFQSSPEYKICDPYHLNMDLNLLADMACDRFGPHCFFRPTANMASTAWDCAFVNE